MAHLKAYEIQTLNSYSNGTKIDRLWNSGLSIRNKIIEFQKKLLTAYSCPWYFVWAANKNWILPKKSYCLGHIKAGL